MSLRLVVGGRLASVVNTVRAKPPVVLNDTMQLGLPPIGFDATRLAGAFMVALHSQQVGFRDFLKKPIPQGKVTPTTTFGDLVTTIEGASIYADASQYEGAMKARMLLALRKVIAAHSSPKVRESDVDPNRLLTDYVNMADTQVHARFVNALRKPIGKYLLAPLRPTDFAGTVNRVRLRLVTLSLA